MTKKRFREVSTVDVELVEVLEDLAQIDEKTRLTAAHRLLTHFVQHEETDGRRLLAIFRKLIRGICSGRKAARLGFSIALTESLSSSATYLKKDQRDPDFNLEKLFSLLRDATAVSSGLSKQEQRDHYLGQLFAAEAILRSGVCFQTPYDITAWSKILDFIFDLGLKKPWLKQECGFLLFSLVSERVLPMDCPLYAEAILERLELNSSARTPEGVAIWLAVTSLHPKVTLPLHIWENNDPLNLKAKHQLGLALADASLPVSKDHEIQDFKASGRWSPALHFCWWAVISEILPSPSRQTSLNRVTFETFWAACINDIYFAANSSLERKSTGFAILRSCVLEVPNCCLPSLFTKDICRCLINHLSPTHDRYLHHAAETVRQAILKRGGDAASALCLLKSLPMAELLHFDERTKTKTVAELMSHVAPLEPIDLVSFLGASFEKLDSDTEEEVHRRRKSLVDHAVAVVKSAPSEMFNTAPFTLYIRRLLSFLASYSYHDLKRVDSVPGRVTCISIPSKTRLVFRSGIATCLARVIAQHKDASDILQPLITDIVHLKASEMSHSLLLSVDDEIRKLLNNVQDLLASLSDRMQNGKDVALAQAGSLLLSICLIQVYNEDPDSINTLEDLARIFGSLTASAPAQHDWDSNDFIECLLTLETRRSLLLRRTCSLAFQCVTHLVDQGGLQPLLKVLRAKETLAGQAEVFESLDEEGLLNDPSNLGSIHASHGSSAPNVNHAGHETSTGSSSMTTSRVSSEPEDEDDEDQDDPELAAFDAQLAQALQAPKKVIDSDTSQTSSDLNAYDDMDDEQMEALDQSLAAIFQERKKITNKKTERRSAIASVQDLKLRCLELLDIFLEKEHSKIMCVDLIVPVLSLIRTTRNRQIAVKGREIIKKYATSCKGSGVPSFGQSGRIWQEFVGVHAQARLKGSTLHGQACSQASLLLVRILIFSTNGSRELRPVINAYSDMQQQGLDELVLFDQRWWPAKKELTAFMSRMEAAATVAAHCVSKRTGRLRHGVADCLQRSSSLSTVSQDDLARYVALFE